MSNMQVQSSTVEENFVFGSPPLLNGFTYNTCRAQEGSVNPSTTSHHIPSCKLDVESTCRGVVEEIHSDMYCQNKYPASYGPNRSSYTGFPLKKGASVLDNLNQLYMNNNGRSYHVDSGIKLLEQAGIKVQKFQQYEQQQQQQFVFKKRKDLRVLKSVLSNERFKKVTMMFGDGDEGGKEIVESVHKAMRTSNLSAVTCLFCDTESQVYENFPIVDGTLFLSPLKLSKECVRFEDKLKGITTERHMCFICVGCLEGKPNRLRCSSCLSPWNGSFFQVGTLYSYNILSAIPCCEMRVECKNCSKAIINLGKGEASTLYFSHFSSKTTCPNCYVEDYHYIKSIETLRKSTNRFENE